MPPTGSFSLADIPVAELVARASEAPLPSDAVVAQLVDSDDAEALEELVCSHLRIAIDEAIRSRGLGERQDRLVRMAAEAVIDAAPEYDAVVHGRFSTFVRATARAAISRHLAPKGLP